MSIFGPIVPVTLIEQQMLETLKTWLPSYLGEIERVTGRDQGSLPDIKSWGIPERDFLMRPGQALPHVGLVSPGTQGTPQHDAEGFYRATWRIEVRLVVAANSVGATDRLSKAYAAAVAACLVQQTLGDPVEQLDWIGDAYDDLGADKDRSMIGVAVSFDVLAAGVLQRRTGPRGEPQADPRAPYPDLPTIETTELDLTHQP